MGFSWRMDLTVSAVSGLKAVSAVSELLYRGIAAVSVRSCQLENLPRRVVFPKPVILTPVLSRVVSDRRIPVYDVIYDCFSFALMKADLHAWTPSASLDWLGLAWRGKAWLGPA